MKGILFRPKMIQAVVNGSKSQTRRVIRPQPFLVGTNRWHWLPCKNTQIHWTEIYDMEAIIKYAPYQVGGIVYIKEAYKVIGTSTLRQGDRTVKEAGVDYKDGSRIDKVCPLHILADQQWHSPMMMPEWAARYFILIKDVRAERLQEITEEDAEAEGIYSNSIYGDFGFHWESKDSGYETAKTAYRVLWNSINAKYPWESNPWCFRYEFELKEKEK